MREGKGKGSEGGEEKRSSMGFASTFIPISMRCPKIRTASAIIPFFLSLPSLLFRPGPVHLLHFPRLHFLPAQYPRLSIRSPRQRLLLRLRTAKTRSSCVALCMYDMVLRRLRLLWYGTRGVRRRRNTGALYGSSACWRWEIFLSSKLVRGVRDL